MERLNVLPHSLDSGPAGALHPAKVEGFVDAVNSHGMQA